MHIRFALKKDIPALIKLCAAHAAYEKANYTAANKEVHLVEALFTKPVGLKCIVVEKDQQLVGYATFIKQYSTWDADFYLYLDCLFVSEQCRSQGTGKLLMLRVKKYAQEQRCIGIQWQTPHFNSRAIKFYHKLGAFSKAKERFFWDL